MWKVSTNAIIKTLILSGYDPTKNETEFIEAWQTKTTNLKKMDRYTH